MKLPLPLLLLLLLRRRLLLLLLLLLLRPLTTITTTTTKTMMTDYSTAAHNLSGTLLSVWARRRQAASGWLSKSGSLFGYPKY